MGCIASYLPSPLPRLTPQNGAGLRGWELSPGRGTILLVLPDTLPFILKDWRYFPQISGCLREMSAWPQAWLLPPGTPAPSYPRASKKGDAASTPSTNYPSLNWYHVFPSGFKAAARFAVTVDKLRCHLWQSDNLSRSAEAEQRERGKAGGGGCVWFGELCPGNHDLGCVPLALPPGSQPDGPTACLGLAPNGEH